MQSNPANPFAQSFYDQTTIHPLGFAVVLVMSVLVWTLRRRYAIWPVIVIVCFVASAQRVVIFGADFTLLRLMVLFGTLRVVSRQEWRTLRWTRLDTAVVLWAVAGAAMTILRVGMSVLMNRAGMLYDVVGMYFLFRVLLRDWDDVRTAIKGLMWASLIVAAFVLVEWRTGHNAFSVFGGVPAVTGMRDGRMRCQGAFAHPILLGAFFAAVLPLAAGCWGHDRRSRRLVFASCCACALIVFASNSATPLTGVVAAGIGAMLFPFRYRMRWVRWGIAVTVVILHMVMIAPVWHLIARFSVVGGSSSWHRFSLIDGAINHLDEWWLMGSDKGTGHWGNYTFDVTNYYIIQGLHGGLLLLALFVAVMAVSFAEVGKTWRRYVRDRRTLILTWAMGISLWVHAVNLFGVCYFGQAFMGWYLVLGMVGSMAASRPTAVRVRERHASPPAGPIRAAAPMVNAPLLSPSPRPSAI
jgi:hypothetical protein